MQLKEGSDSYVLLGEIKKILFNTLYTVHCSLFNILQLVKKPREFPEDVGEVPANHLTQL